MLFYLVLILWNFLYLINFPRLILFVPQSLFILLVHETEISFFNMEAYQKYKANPETLW